MVSDVVTLWFFLLSFFQEYHPVLCGLAFCDSYCQASPPPLESSTRYHLCTGIHPIRLLFRCHEAVCLVHTTRGWFLRPSDMSLANLIWQTGWGTRAGIGDASAATAAMDANNEKSINNNPYQQQADSYHNLQNALSPFRDQAPPSPYHDTPATTPIYASRATGNRRGDEEGLEMQVGYAR